MALFNSFTFGDVNSEDYGVYISGDSVYDSPARSVDLVQVPGRNGALALDNGYYENIEVTYPAGSFGTSQEEWREKMLGIRNALAAQRGYQKLIDTYHPEHYRLGMFFAGISASPVQYNRAGQFPIRFNCKPQRFLISGDEAVEFTAEGQEEVYGPDSIVSFEAKAGAEIRELTVNLEPIQSGTGDPSPTNIRPIYGHTAVQVTRAGKNVCEQVLQGYINQNATPHTFVIDNNSEAFVFRANKGTTYCFSSAVAFSRRILGRVNEVRSGAIIEEQTSLTANVWTATWDGLTVFYCYPYKNEAIEASAQVELGSTATAYEPYAGQTYNVPLGQTVYGGTLNATTGVLTIDRAMVDLGTRSWTYVSADTVFYTSISDKKDGNANIICSAYKSGGNTGYSTPDYTVGHSTNSSLSKRIFISDPNYTTAAAFKTAMNGVQLCYELATPLTYQLTPTQVSTLLGANNIYVDSGEVEVKVASPVDLTNPTNFPAKPLIRIYGNGSVRVGDTIAAVQNNADGYVDIDCESMNCYDPTGGRNADVSFSGNDFPELASGDNGILLTGPSKVEITPRWWEL